MGKPPISDAAMRKMYGTMERLRAVRRDTGTWKGVPRERKVGALAEPESLLAGVLSQMHRRDTLLTAGEHPLLQTAVEVYFPISVSSLHSIPCAGTDEECVSIAAGMALRSMESARDPIAVTVALLNTFPHMPATFRLMEQQSLPLLVVVRGDAEPRAVAEKRMRSTKVPILPVDAADAIAVCRVMQEAMLRARNGWGGSVIHAIAMPGVTDPLAGMAERMRARGLL